MATILIPAADVTVGTVIDRSHVGYWATDMIVTRVVGCAAGDWEWDVRSTSPDVTGTYIAGCAADRLVPVVVADDETDPAPAPTLPEGYTDVSMPSFRVTTHGYIAQVHCHRCDTGVWHPFYVGRDGQLTPYPIDAQAFHPTDVEAAARAVIAAIKGGR